MNKPFLVALLLAAGCSFAQTTSFETTDDFTAGQSIIGLNGWSTYTQDQVLSQQLAYITDEKSFSQSQSLKLDTNLGYDDSGATNGVVAITPVIASNSSTQTVSFKLYIANDAAMGASTATIELLSIVEGYGTPLVGNFTFRYDADIWYLVYESPTNRWTFVPDFQFPFDQWFSVTIERHDNVMDLYINGDHKVTTPTNPLAGTIHQVAFGNDNYSTPIYLDDLYISDELSIHQPNQTAFAVYPNPARDLIKLQAQNAQQLEKATVYTLNGKIVLEQPLTATANTLSIAHLPEGAYILQVQHATGVESLKLLKSN